MNKKTPQDYARELIELYHSKPMDINGIKSVEQTASEIPHPMPYTPVFEDGTGGIQVNVTTLGRLYPVSGASVTVFIGNGENKKVIETDTTNSSGQSGVFNLKTPPKSDSQQSQIGGHLPYSTYNISIKSDGYVEQIAMNVPVFSGVISVQGIDLVPISAAGNHTAPQIINEAEDYNL